MQTYLDNLRVFLTVERVSLFTLSLVRIAAILVMAVVVVKLLSARSVRRLQSHIVRMMKVHRPGGEAIQFEKRAATIGSIVRKTVAVVVWLGAGVMVMKELNFDIAPILAGAGVIGLAVGFGAQNLVRDVISGLFMLVENQISVNDVAIINGTNGVVEELNLRTTVLRGGDGTVHIFPNGAITSLSNMTHEFSYYVFDVNVTYKEDTDRVVVVLKQVAEEMRGDSDYASLILEPLDVLGVDRLGDSSITVKVRLKTLPARQWEVGREMNRRIKKRFDAEGIEIPAMHRTTSLPVKLAIDDSTREQLKQIVREVLAEPLAERAVPDAAESGKLSHDV